MGGKDGIIRTFDSASGATRSRSYEHNGPVMAFVYCHSIKCMFSLGVDGTVVTWSASGAMYDKICIGEPLYCADVAVRHKCLVVGLRRSVRIYAIDEWKESGHALNMHRPRVQIDSHDDIVKRILCVDCRVSTSWGGGQLRGIGAVPR